MLQPLRGQTVCLDCPSEGADCTVQNEVDLLDGWYRDTGVPAGADDEAKTDTAYNISYAIAGSVEDLDQAAHEKTLNTYLQ